MDVLKDIGGQIRSDLFLESAGFQEEREHGGDLPVREYEKNGLHVTEVCVKTAEQSARLNRVRGRYITIFSEELKENDGGIHQAAVNETAVWLRKLLPEKIKTVFVAGLGNSEASPDALGPDAVNHVAVNRHVRSEENQDMRSEENQDIPSEENHDVRSEENSQKGLSVCAMIPGVMAKTGMETANILTGVIEKIKPDALVVVDALAARSVTRLGTTIQITDAGIFPGSGVGNHRREISHSVLGIPVIAIGIPMVVEAAAIIYETIDAIRSALQQENMEQDAGFLKQLSREEQYDLFRELLEKKARPLYVTVKDVDEIEKRLAFTLSEALNRAFSGMNSDPQT